MSFSAIKLLARDRSGTAAIEFAFAAPVLLFGLLMVTDVGLAVNERINLDQSVRAGAELAMSNVDDETTLEDMVKAASTGAYGSALGDVDSTKIPTVDVTRTCECPDAPGTAVTCDELCTGDVVPSILYDFTASINYNSIFLPDIPLSTQMKVQVR